MTALSRSSISRVRSPRSSSARSRELRGRLRTTMPRSSRLAASSSSPCATEKGRPRLVRLEERERHLTGEVDRLTREKDTAVAERDDLAADLEAEQGARGEADRRATEWQGKHGEEQGLHAVTRRGLEEARARAGEFDRLHGDERGEHATTRLSRDQAEARVRELEGQLEGVHVELASVRGAAAALLAASRRRTPGWSRPRKA